MTDDPAAAGAQAGAIADVLMPVALDTAYSYAVPPGMALEPGAFVEAPLGPRMALGVVWALRPAPQGASNLKSIAARVDAAPLNQHLRDFIDWVARWSMSARGMVLRMAIRAAFQAAPEVARAGVRLAGPAPPAHDACAGARTRRDGRRRDPRQGGARESRRLLGERHRRPDP